MSDEYPESRYLETIEALASASRDDCHPALFDTRDHMIEELTNMSRYPSEPHNQAWLRTVDFFLYRRRAKVFYNK